MRQFYWIYSVYFYILAVPLSALNSQTQIEDYQFLEKKQEHLNNLAEQVFKQKGKKESIFKQKGIAEYSFHV